MTNHTAAVSTGPVNSTFTVIHAQSHGTSSTTSSPAPEAIAAVAAAVVIALGSPVPMATEKAMGAFQTKLRAIAV